MQFNYLKGKKYSLSDDYVEYKGKKLYQIYMNNYVDIGSGVLLTVKGGYVESEANLSHEGECWIEPGCYVYGNAKVEGNALVTSDEEGNPSIVGGMITIKDEAVVVSSILKGIKTIGGNTLISWNKVQSK